MAKFLQILALVVLLLIVVEVVSRVAYPARELWLELPNPPDAGEVFVLGNSMFKTGIDFELFQNLTKQPTAFNYFNGYYSNLFYLVVKNALVPSGVKPPVVVWGFRPFYASTPAFRQNKPGYIEQYVLEHEPTYEAIVAARENSWQDQVNLWLANVRIYSLRERAQKALLDQAKSIFVSALPVIDDRYASLEQQELVRNRSVSDSLIAAITQNKVVMSEELVADVATTKQDQRFIVGDRVGFDQSFVPLIADLLKDAGINQLVVVFKPVAEVMAGSPTEVVAYKDEAIAFFASSGIPVANVYDELELSIEDYGSGDHYNESGRRKVTQYVAETFSRHFSTIQ